MFKKSFGSKGLGLKLKVQEVFWFKDLGLGIRE